MLTKRIKLNNLCAVNYKVEKYICLFSLQYICNTKIRGKQEKGSLLKWYRWGKGDEDGRKKKR